MLLLDKMPTSNCEANGDPTMRGVFGVASIFALVCGDVAEIFLNTRKHGTAVDVSARDAAIAASLLLQHGCHVDTLRKALTRNSDGSASGPLAHALDILQP